jgi:hypothetical protein
MTKEQLYDYLEHRLKSFPRFPLSASDLRDVLVKMIDFTAQAPQSPQGEAILKAPGNTSALAQDGDWKVSVSAQRSLQKHKRVSGQWVLVEEDTL